MPEGPATILGGLPVIAEVSFGVDDSESGREYWSEVDCLYWMKKDGSKGKPIPQHIYDRAEAYDYGLCTVTEQVSDYLAYEQYRREQTDNVRESVGLPVRPNAVRAAMEVLNPMIRFT